ncbi:hypothetical protein [Cellulomonas shaoxiangyii]|uniref:Uncharacterized protein n=1 Tax=Cellulomonas shaoxiangyii TaxID=2566013 RepID=A0A4P7SKJ9_9CELL|nr:hypothetical protein [Cellulomonas shaoxiangyii]QCB94391.1 hypothetical protein E5225_13325 [Cellulomonas shaoxiangyii]TGY84761.1 hypothetical protein E5226_09790 [Cellulomonas shaoxiangyii]
MSEPDDALAAAPHLRRFHELHPEVPLVVLPPERTAPPEPPVPDDVLDAERSATDAVLAMLLDAVGTAADAAAVRTLWRAGRVDDTVVPVAEARLPLAAADEAPSVAGPLATALERGGWTLRSGRSGAARYLEGARGERTVRVVAVEDVVVVTVRGRELPVPTATQHRLMGVEGEA